MSADLNIFTLTVLAIAITCLTKSAQLPYSS